jgi:hypothetical protein
MIVVVSTVSFLPVQEARALTELKYDDGTAELLPGTGGAGLFVAVRFVLADFGIIGSTKLVEATYYISGDEGGTQPGVTGSRSTWSDPQGLGASVQGTPATYRVHILGSDGFTDLFTSPILSATGPHKWVTIDLSSSNIIVAGSFYVAIEWVAGAYPGLAGDSDNPGHTYAGTPGNLKLVIFSEAMIRASVGLLAPVGGVVMPTNTLAITAPYLALAGLIAVVSAVVVVKRNRD